MGSIRPPFWTPAWFAVAGVALAGCLTSSSPARTSAQEELSGLHVLGVRFGETEAQVKARMEKARIKLDEVETALTHPQRALVYFRSLDDEFNVGLRSARYHFAQGRLVSIDLQYDGDVADSLKVRIESRWGEGEDRGPVGMRWRGDAATATLMPGNVELPLRLLINRRYRGGFRARPLKGLVKE